MNNRDMDFWINNSLNVLMTGHAGVGKTARIIEAFERHELTYQYFSAATMDPWVDFVGIPKEERDDDGKGSHLTFVRPEMFSGDGPDAIFFDELNRAPKKVLNAVMELIQFKSINGKMFPNLKMVWGAVNPSDDEDVTYSVNDLDPAQLDRFQVHVKVPYKLDVKYFTNKFGKDHTDAAVEWWGGLPEKVKRIVSPRRVDYALGVFKLGGELGYVLPTSSSYNDLHSRLMKGSYGAIYEAMKNDAVKLKVELKDNNFLSWITDNFAQLKETALLIDCLPSEQHSILLNQYIKHDAVFADLIAAPAVQSTMAEIVQSGKNPKLIKKLQLMGAVQVPADQQEYLQYLTASPRKHMEASERVLILNAIANHIVNASPAEFTDKTKYDWEAISLNVVTNLQASNATSYAKLDASNLQVLLTEIAKHRSYSATTKANLNKKLVSIGVTV